MAGRGRISNGFNDRDDYYTTEVDHQDYGSHTKPPNQRREGQPTLHVANIPPGLDEKGLGNIFAAECSMPQRVFISKNRKSQQNTFWGFVEFSTVAEAQTAISAVHKKPPYELSVQFSKAYQEGNKEKPSEKSLGNIGPSRGQGQFFPMKERNNFRTSRSNDESYNEDFGEDNNSFSFSSSMEKNTSSPAEKLTGLPIEKYTHVEVTDEMDLHVAAYMSSRAKDLTLDDLSDLCSEIKLALPFKPGQCTYCLRTAIYTCSRCKTWYCSDFCRTTHWPQHKDKCSPRSVIFEKDGTLTYKDVPDAFCAEQPVMQKNISAKSPRGFQGKNVGLDYQNDGFNNCHSYDNGFERNTSKVSDKFRDNIENGNRSPDDRFARDNHTASDQGNRGYQRNNRRGGGVDRRGGGRQFGGRPDRNILNNRTRTNESDCYNSVEPFNEADLDKSQSHKSSNLNKAPIPAATFTNVTIGAVRGDNEFWAYKLDDYQKQGAIMSELKKCVLQGDLADIRIEIGSKCIAPYEGDWYRAEIIQIFRDNVKVVFVDFGNESDVKKCDLKSLPDFIASEPPMAHRFVLANSPDNPKLHEELTFSIKPLMQDKSGRWVVHADGVNYPAMNGFEDS